MRFTDVTVPAGLGDYRHHTGAFGQKWFPETMGSGLAFLDYDGDGWQDLLVAGGGAWPQSPSQPARVLWLYRNNGDGTFVLRSKDAGLDDVRAYTFGLTVADYDNDGDPDVYCTTLERNLLFRNEGGTFHEVGQQAGVAGPPAWSSSALFFDADRDGHLDLFVGRYVQWSPERDLFCSLDGQTKSYCTPETYEAETSRYYHNNGDGTFTDHTEAAGFGTGPGKTLGVAEFDYNRDGWPDVFVANDTEPNALYRNNGDGTFTEQGAASGIAFDENGKARAGMGIDVGVVDSTGQPTVFIGNFSREMIGVYRHLGEGLFIDRAAVSQVGRPSLLTLTFAVLLLDLDLDGDLDLFGGNGHVQPEIETTQAGISYAQAPHLFLNQGDGTFTDVAPTLGGILAQPMLARGIASADYDRDGDLDLALVENGAALHLWRNDLRTPAQPAPHFLRVRVQGSTSNRDALGTRLVALVGRQRQERRIRSGSSYLSASEPIATFGLGSATRVDTLWVEWPNGVRQQLANVDANQELTLTELPPTNSAIPPSPSNPQRP
jgi:hypothetical protein